MSEFYSSTSKNYNCKNRNNFPTKKRERQLAAKLHTMTIQLGLIEHPSNFPPKKRERQLAAKLHVKTIRLGLSEHPSNFPPKKREHQLAAKLHTTTIRLGQSEHHGNFTLPRFLLLGSLRIVLCLGISLELKDLV